MIVIGFGAPAAVADADVDADVDPEGDGAVADDCASAVAPVRQHNAAIVNRR
jgi:hypothetical protein